MTEVKNYVYLTLKKKPLIEKILDDVKEEAERRFNIFIQSKINFLQSIKPDDPQAFLECFLLRGLIKILDKMFEERNMKLNQFLKNYMEEIKKGKVMNMMIFLKIKVLNFAHLKNEKISIVQLIII